MTLNKPFILLADPLEKNVEEMMQQLKLSGFDVEHSSQKSELIQKLESSKVDIVILNLKQSETDAVSICQEIRTSAKIHQPFVVIYNDTAEDYVQVTCYNSGADLFLIQPLNPFLLVARLKALLKRRFNDKFNSDEKSNKGFFADFESYEIVKDSMRYTLPKKEFEIVSYLLTIPKKVFSRQEIAAKVWGDEKVSQQRTIDIHIRNIRKVIGKESIRTIKGMGYSIF